MSARRIHGLTATGFDKLIALENIHIEQINGEMKKDLDGIEEGVREAKTLVQETQSKMDELEESIGKIIKS